jgi:hypothetical protein
MNWKVGDNADGDNLLSLSLFRTGAVLVVIEGDCVIDTGVMRLESQYEGKLKDET